MQLTLCFSGALEISPKRCTAQRRKRRLRVAHAATRLTLRKLHSTMQVGRLDVMPNVVSASSLLVHRNEDAENSFSVEPNDVDILRAAALREALPDDQRCIADKSVSVRPLLTVLSERNSEHSMTRDGALIRGATNDCTNSATASLQLQVREARVVSGKPNAACAEKARQRH
jgi:hypothetical protein